MDKIFTKNIEHESAKKHVTGKAIYTDDIPEPQNLLHAAIGYSNYSKGIIKKIDLTDVINSEGVIDVITEADIKGVNDVGPIFKGDKIFTSKEIEYHGQPIFAVIAKSNILAKKASLKANIIVKELKPIITIKDAIKKKSYVLKPRFLNRGDTKNNLKKSENILSGELYSGGQDHFYLEGQIAMTIPQEDDNFLIYSSTQHPSETQQIVAKVLNQNFNSIHVVVRRIGGGFGGKETQSFLFAAIAAIASKKLNKPVKLRVDRDDDMIMTGKRHDFYFKYTVGFSNKGKINTLKVIMASRCGISADLSGAINDRAIYHIDNAYFIPNIEIESYRCKTNTVSNTAFRGFGGPQGMFCIENILENISQKINEDPIKVRKLNFYKKNINNETHYGMKITDNVINDIFNQLIKKSEYHKRKKEIQKFNDKQKVLKKGISITPIKFGISFTTTHLNQAGALVHIYTDGSVHLNHGGIEMGQGLMTKLAQITSHELGLSYEFIKITSTDTEKVPNTSASAASATTDLNGGAIINAIYKLKSNLNNFIYDHYNVKSIIRYENDYVHFDKRKITFKELISKAYLNRISLSSSGFFKTSKIDINTKTLKGRPFLYFTYGAAVSEVIVDTLTGENKLLQVDIIHDVGNSINKRIDKGQIEGGFIQGLGWLTTEEISWRKDGNILTHSPSTYKIPTAGETPFKLNVEIYKSGFNKEEVVNRSKAVGEPPFMLAISSFTAIKDAVFNANKKKGSANLIAPATPENILKSIY
ncbi:MAG: xanthine dehydrogenase molybdopterin binding subunit [Pelagibacteraceae bacterium]|nr:xanthine dehydrogenase molybdopterin binding subunit [Pelagibacteraceae bacterium]